MVEVAVLSAMGFAFVALSARTVDCFPGIVVGLVGLTLWVLAGLVAAGVIA